MLYLDKVIKSFKTAFPNEGSSAFSQINKLPASDETLIELIALFLPLKKEVWKNLNLSVLVGEYISNIDVFENKLDETERSVEEMRSFFIPRETEFDAKIESQLVLVIDPMILAIKYYRTLLDLAKLKLDHGYSALDLTMFKFEQKVHDDYLDLFKANTTIAEIDLTLSLSTQSNMAQSLFVAQAELGEIDADPQLKKIILDKCNFLLKKLSLRSTIDHTKDYLYSINFEVGGLKGFDCEIEYFKDFLDLTEIHYTADSHEFPSEIITELLEKHRQGTSLSLKEYHCLIHVYKDFEKDEGFLADLVHQIQNKNATTRPGIKGKFNQKAYDISYNYFLNNEFAFYIDNQPDREELIEEKLNNLLTQQSITSVKNYFSDLKYAGYLRDRLDQIFRSKSNIDILKTEQKVQQFRRYLISATNKLEDCQNRNFMAFQLTFEECLVDCNYNNESIQVLLASSFYLPINYERKRAKLAELKEEYSAFKSQLALHRVSQDEKKEIEVIKNEIEKKETKAIEVISIFSAIVLFAAGNIQLWSKVDDLVQAITFMLAFSFSLGLFITLVFYTTRRNNEKKETPRDKKFLRRLFIILGSLLILTTFFLLVLAGEIIIIF